MTIDKLPEDKEEVKPQRTPEELRIALHTCEVQLRDVRAMKKSVTSSYNDQIKDINDEIGGILDQLKQLEAK